MSDTENKLLHADLTYKIRGVLFHVGNNLWPGLPEEDVQKAVSIGLAKRQIPNSTEEEFHVCYRDVEVGRYYCDIAVDRKVILELKVVPVLTGLHRAQIISYLRVTGADVGLLVNFGGPKVEIERYAYFYAHRRPDFTWQPQIPDDPTLLYPDLYLQRAQSNIFVGAPVVLKNEVWRAIAPTLRQKTRWKWACILQNRRFSGQLPRSIAWLHHGQNVTLWPC